MTDCIECLERCGVHADYFSSHCKIDDVTGCWIWTGFMNYSGYGMATVHQKAMRAHRYSWIIHKGDIPKGMCVLHKCDNRGCVNPSHLWIGSHADNMRDMCRKGRQNFQLRPEDQLSLTIQQIAEIRKTYVPRKMSQERLAKKFGVSRSTICNVLSTTRF
jgi:hypothetical protein